MRRRHGTTLTGNADALPVVLVHGAWTGAWVWRPVQRHLRRMGIRTLAVSLPSQVHVSACLDADVAAIDDGLAGLAAPALVVAHSYAGVPVTQAAASNVSVVRLVYIAAAMVDVGESTLDLLGRDPDPSWWLRFLIGTRPGRRLMDVARMRSMLSRRRAVREETFVLAATPSAAGWRRVPSTYVVLTRDLIFSAALQRRLAERADRVVQLTGFHVAVMYRPRAIAQIIAREARTGADEEASAVKWA